MKTILMSLMVVALVGGLVGGGLFAAFSDTETSTGNTFSSAALDLEVDSSGDQNWGPVDIDDEVFFNNTAIVPGDSGEVTISLHLKTGSATSDILMKMLNYVPVNTPVTEPEGAAETAIGNTVNVGEKILVELWVDNYDDQVIQTPDDVDYPGDNVRNPTYEPVLYSGTLAGLNTWLQTAANQKVVTAAEACDIHYLGLSWILPCGTGNEVQADSVTFDIQFSAEVGC